MGMTRSTNAMEKSLIIVESPAKAKTINKYLGKEYIVEASVGHIKNLPKSKMSVDVEKDFDVVYETISGKEDVVNKLRSKAEKASPSISRQTLIGREKQSPHTSRMKSRMWLQTSEGSSSRDHGNRRKRSNGPPA